MTPALFMQPISVNEKAVNSIFLRISLNFSFIAWAIKHALPYKGSDCLICCIRSCLLLISFVMEGKGKKIEIKSISWEKFLTSVLGYCVYCYDPTKCDQYFFRNSVGHRQHRIAFHLLLELLQWFMLNRQMECCRWRMSGLSHLSHPSVLGWSRLIWRMAFAEWFSTATKIRNMAWGWKLSIKYRLFTN